MDGLDAKFKIGDKVIIDNNYAIVLNRRTPATGGSAVYTVKFDNGRTGVYPSHRVEKV
jgi:hypothetical protein